MRSRYEVCLSLLRPDQISSVPTPIREVVQQLLTPGNTLKWYKSLGRNSRFYKSTTVDSANNRNNALASGTYMKTVAVLFND